MPLPDVSPQCVSQNVSRLCGGSATRMYYLWLTRGPRDSRISRPSRLVTPMERRKTETTFCGQRARSLSLSARRCARTPPPFTQRYVADSVCCAFAARAVWKNTSLPSDRCQPPGTASTSRSFRLHWSGLGGTFRVASGRLSFQTDRNKFCTAYSSM